MSNVTSKPPTPPIDKYQVLEALQATADFSQRRGVTDITILMEYHLLYLEALVRGLIDDE